MKRQVQMNSQRSVRKLTSFVMLFEEQNITKLTVCCIFIQCNDYLNIFKYLPSLSAYFHTMFLGKRSDIKWGKGIRKSLLRSHADV